MSVTLSGSMFKPCGHCCLCTNAACLQLVPTAIVEEFTGKGIPTMLLIEACISVGMLSQIAA